jgi:hypothetical protein
MTFATLSFIVDTSVALPIFVKSGEKEDKKITDLLMRYSLFEINGASGSPGGWSGEGAAHDAKICFLFIPARLK